MSARLHRVPVFLLVVLLGTLAGHAAETNTSLLIGGALPAPAPEFDAGSSVVRLFGALLLVVALFLGGVWLFRNWQKVVQQRRGGTRLDVVEVRSLGNRQSLVVVGYGSQRLLLGATPTGISLLTHLPADESEPGSEPAPAPAPRAPGFVEAFQQVIAGRKP